MSVSGIFARVVALIGDIAIFLRHRGDRSLEPAYGAAPTIPPARPQAIPTLKMPTARGWTAGQTPIAAAGLKVNAFAAGLRHPRWICVLPTGDVLAAEALSVAGPIKTAFDYAIFATMKRAAAVGVSPNRITLLRDADGDGVAETREVFLNGLNQPFGMTLVGETFYVGNTDAVIAFPYKAGDTRIRASGQKLIDLKAGGHWTRSLPMDESSSLGSARSATLARAAWRQRKDGPPSTSLTSRAARAASLPLACATPWAWRGSQRPAHSGLSSMSATDWETKRLPTI
jgi:glucose/arabinose dehydrogenase